MVAVISASASAMADMHAYTNCMDDIKRGVGNIFSAVQSSIPIDRKFIESLAGVTFGVLLRTGQAAVAAYDRSQGIPISMWDSVMREDIRSKWQGVAFMEPVIAVPGGLNRVNSGTINKEEYLRIFNEAEALLERSKIESGREIALEVSQFARNVALVVQDLLRQHAIPLGDDALLVCAMETPPDGMINMRWFTVDSTSAENYRGTLH